MNSELCMVKGPEMSLQVLNKSERIIRMKTICKRYSETFKPQVVLKYEAGVVAICEI